MKAEKAMLSTALFVLRLAITVLVIIGIYRVGEYSYLYSYSVVSDAAIEAAPGRDISVTLSKGVKPKEIASFLERKGLVKDAKVFQIQIKLNGYEEDLKSGTYILNTSMTPREMMRVMAGEEEEKE
ncbi:MAG: endolytic transglycosylase MltG [Lachnospiraceae bacterium]|nr:endolytic transglycosylase MltG [Lachnospiraceae bacterium]